jgi:hypothetical protein
MERKRKLQKHLDIFSEQVRYYKNKILMELNRLCLFGAQRQEFNDTDGKLSC